MSPEIKHLSDLMTAQNKIFERLLNHSKKQTEILHVMLTPEQKKKLDALRLAAVEKATIAARAKLVPVGKKPLAPVATAKPQR